MTVGTDDDELWITIDDEPVSEPGDLEWLELAVRTAVTGSVRRIDGTGRHRLEIEVGEGRLGGAVRRGLPDDGPSSSVWRSWSASD
jgi:hypothetical protein